MRRYLGNKRKKSDDSRYRTVMLDDGEPCRVRILGLFETRHLPMDWDVPFTYEIVSHTGKVYNVKFPFYEYAEEPKQPTTPRHEAAEKTRAYDDWRTYDLYQAAKLHYEEMERRLRQYLDALTDHIMARCLSADDARRVTTLRDMEKIREAALTRPVSKEVLQEVLKTQFNASFDGEDVIEQLFAESEDDGGGRYAVMLTWEAKLMNSLGLSQSEYSALPILDRAVRVCADNLSSWMEALEMKKSKEGRGKWHPLGALGQSSGLA